MAKTLLNLVNDLQEMLGQSTTASVSTTTASKRIGHFINQAKRKVEDAWSWSKLRTSIDITTASGTKDYTLTGSGDRFKILEVVDDTNNNWLRPVNYDYIRRTQYIGTTSNTNPIYYNVNGVSSGDSQVSLEPTPGGVYTIKFFGVKPQADFVISTTTDDATAISVPFYPVYLLAWSYLLRDRGEDGALHSSEVYQEYLHALGDATQIDTSFQAEEMVWRVV